MVADMKIKIHLAGREIEWKPAAKHSIRQGTVAKVIKSQRMEEGTVCQTRDV